MRTASKNRAIVVVAAIGVGIPLLIAIVLIVRAFFPTGRFADWAAQAMAYFVGIKIWVLSAMKLIVTIVALVALFVAWSAGSHRRANNKGKSAKRP